MFHRTRNDADAKTSGRSARKQRAQESWTTAATALAAEDIDAARAGFDAAVKADDQMSDAWLGLHALGVEQGQALAQMQSYPGRFGEERRRTGLPLSSSFQIGPYAVVPLSSGRDLWAAVGADYLDRGMYQHAQRAILGQIVPVAAGATRQAEQNFDAAVPEDDPYAQYLVGRLEYLRSDVAGALRWFTGLLDGGDVLAASALYLTGQLHTAAGNISEAMAAYDRAVTVQHDTATVSPSLGAAALVASGMLAASHGETGDAHARLTAAAELDPHLPELRKAVDSLH